MNIINFGAGPGKLPKEVLLEVQKEFVNYGDTGISVVEMSHRSPHYDEINKSTIQSIRHLLKVPDNYKILFMQGGGTGLFAAVAMNLMGRTGSADYLVTGSWSSKAATEAAKYGKVNLVLPKSDKYIDIPSQDTWNINENASYLYYCANETISGIEFSWIPESKVPLVADMSSNIFSRPIDVSKFGVIFAGAQKNIGPAGVTLVIVRDDLLGSPMSICPSVLDFTIMAKNNSIYNTPPTFSIYTMGKVFEWVKKKGGVENMDKSAKAKSELIYGIIDSSNNFYSYSVKPSARSRMNITFNLSTPELEKEFLDGAKKLNMIQLKGHRSVGGIRVSLYNAISLEETKVLAEYMKSFMKKHQS